MVGIRVGSGMKAYLLEKYGAPLRLADVAEPVAGPGEVVIDAAAVSVNPIDAALASGALRSAVRLSLPARMGFDVAGTISEVGEGVTGLAIGDRVMSRVDQAHMGSFAEKVAVEASVVVPAPAGVGLAEAASLPLASVTALQVLVERGHIGPGSRVLIHAGAGGVGSAAIQIAKHLGAHVATTVSTPNVDYARSLGADEVIDRRTQDFTQVVHGMDLVLDGVGEANVRRSLTVVRPGGLVVGLSTPPDLEVARVLGLGAVGRLVVRLMSARVHRDARRLGARYAYHLLHPNGPDLDTIRRLVEEGILAPQVGRRLPFEEIPEALAGLKAGGARGKTVVVLDPSRA